MIYNIKQKPEPCYDDFIWQCTYRENKKCNVFIKYFVVYFCIIYIFNYDKNAGNGFNILNIS